MLLNCFVNKPCFQIPLCPFSLIQKSAFSTHDCKPAARMVDDVSFSVCLDPETSNFNLDYNKI